MVSRARLALLTHVADSTPVQLIQALILDLLQEVTGDIVGDSGLPEVSICQTPRLSKLCTLLRSSSSSTIQCTAYKLLSQVIRRRTEALVLEVEVSVGNAEEGHASKEIALPDELVDIVKQGVDADWHADGVMPDLVGLIPGRG
jgi:hypothetical protein